MQHNRLPCKSRFQKLAAPQQDPTSRGRSVVAAPAIRLRAFRGGGGGGVRKMKSAWASFPPLQGPDHGPEAESISSGAVSLLREDFWTGLCNSESAQKAQARHQTCGMLLSARRTQACRPEGRLRRFLRRGRCRSPRFSPPFDVSPYPSRPKICDAVKGEGELGDPSLPRFIPSTNTCTTPQTSPNPDPMGMALQSHLPVSNGT